LDYLKALQFNLKISLFIFLYSQEWLKTAFCKAVFSAKKALESKDFACNVVKNVCPCFYV